MAPDLNSPVSLSTVWGSSSRLVQVTVDPAITVEVVGENIKSLTTTLVESVASAVEGFQGVAPTNITSAAAAINNRERTKTISGSLCVCRSLGQRFIAQHQGARMLHYRKTGDAKHCSQLIRGHLERS